MDHKKIITISERREPRRDVTLATWVYGPMMALSPFAAATVAGFLMLAKSMDKTDAWLVMATFVTVFGAFGLVIGVGRLLQFSQDGISIYNERREIYAPTEQTRAIPTNKDAPVFMFTEGKDNFTARQLNIMRDEAAATGKLTRNDAMRVFSGTEYQTKRDWLHKTGKVDSVNRWMHGGYLWLRLFPTTPTMGDEIEPSPRDDDGDDGGEQ